MILNIPKLPQFYCKNYKNFMILTCMAVLRLPHSKSDRNTTGSTALELNLLFPVLVNSSVNISNIVYHVLS